MTYYSWIDNREILVTVLDLMKIFIYYLSINIVVIIIITANFVSFLFNLNGISSTWAVPRNILWPLGIIFTFLIITYRKRFLLFIRFRSLTVTRIYTMVSADLRFDHALRSFSVKLSYSWSDQGCWFAPRPGCPWPSWSCSSGGYCQSRPGSHNATRRGSFTNLPTLLIFSQCLLPYLFQRLWESEILSLVI